MLDQQDIKLSHRIGVFVGMKKKQVMAMLNHYGFEIYQDSINAEVIRGLMDAFENEEFAQQFAVKLLEFENPQQVTEQIYYKNGAGIAAAIAQGVGAVMNGIGNIIGSRNARQTSENEIIIAALNAETAKQDKDKTGEYILGAAIIGAGALLAFMVLK